jgi:uncharacterized protein YbjT (DUF2867 family)
VPSQHFEPIAFKHLNAAHMSTQTIALFGGTGHIGMAIACELVQRGYQVRAIARPSRRAEELSAIVGEVIFAEVSKPNTFRGLLDGCDVVISALGKSVSMADRSKTTFTQVDFEGNCAILNEAQAAGVKKMVYISALHAERYPELAYFRSHHDFSEQLIKSGLDYAIMQPPGLFSVYREVQDMARKGMLGVIGSGNARTNPISEADLACATVDALSKPNGVFPVGGPEVFTRREIAELVQDSVGAKRKLRSISEGLMRKLLLPVVHWIAPFQYEKLAFLVQVSLEDSVGPQTGKDRLEDFLGRE